MSFERESFVPICTAFIFVCTLKGLSFIVMLSYSGFVTGKLCNSNSADA